MTEEPTMEDYLVEVLKGNCKTIKMYQGQIIEVTVTFEQWKNSKKMKQDMRDYLAKRLNRKIASQK